MIDPLVVALAFGAIFVVELPDKTFIATLVMSTKMRPLFVWIGVGLAFLVQTAVAVGIGKSHSLTLLPALDALVKEAGASPADLTGICACVGPGGFTSLRIGVATADGLGAAFVATGHYARITRDGAGWHFSIFVYHGISRKNAKYSTVKMRASSVYRSVAGISPSHDSTRKVTTNTASAIFDRMPL